jgi:hypothetical protein
MENNLKEEEREKQNFFTCLITETFIERNRKNLWFKKRRKKWVIWFENIFENCKWSRTEDSVVECMWQANSSEVIWERSRRSRRIFSDLAAVEKLAAIVEWIYQNYCKKRLLSLINYHEKYSQNPFHNLIYCFSTKFHIIF